MCLWNLFFFQYEMPFVIIIQLVEGGREHGRESFIDWSCQGSKQVSTNKNAFLSAWACVGVAVEEPENKSEL